MAGLILSGNTLYGTASIGGTSGSGPVFGLNTEGAGFTNLYLGKLVFRREWAFVTLRQGGIRWRETFYPLESLRAGNVR